MKSVKTLFAFTAVVLFVGASSPCMAGVTSHETSTNGSDTRMGRTTGNDSITDGTLTEHQGEVTIHEGDERHPSSVGTSAVDKINKQ
jgi:hypothetical protein